jgi:hypothetical protein
MAGSIPTFDPWFPARRGNALPVALSPLQERAVRAVASLLDELRPAQVLPTETVLMLGCQVVTPVPWDGSNKDDRYRWVDICIPHRSLGGLCIHISVAEERPAFVGWWVVWNAFNELMVDDLPETKLPPIGDNPRTLEPVLAWLRTQLHLPLRLVAHRTADGDLAALSCRPEKEGPWVATLSSNDSEPEPPRKRSRFWKRSTVEPPAERAVVTFMDSVEVPWGLPPEVETWEKAWAPPGTYGFGRRVTQYVGCLIGSLLLLALMGAGLIGMLLDVWKSTHRWERGLRAWGASRSSAVKR